MVFKDDSSLLIMHWQMLTGHVVFLKHFLFRDGGTSERYTTEHGRRQVRWGEEREHWNETYSTCSCSLMSKSIDVRNVFCRATGRLYNYRFLDYAQIGVPLEY